MGLISRFLDRVVLTIGGGSVPEVAGSRWRRNLPVLLVVSSFVKFLFFLFGIESARTGNYLPISEGWMDYAYAYIPTVQAFKSGSLPYRDFFHAYPPLFLYTLTAFSVLPCFWSMALPLVLSDALTVIPVYLIARRLSGERNAFLASLVFALSPTNLSYVDYFWLNPPLATLFLLLSIYCLVERRYDMSAITIAVSIGSKQTSLLALPTILLFTAKRVSRRKAAKYFMIVTVICFAFSIPYIFLEPRRYLLSVFRVPIAAWGELPKSYFELGFTNPSGASAIDTRTLEWHQLRWMKYVSLNAPVSLSLPIFIFLLPEAFSNMYPIADAALTIMLLIAYGTLLYKAYRSEQIEDNVLVTCVLYSLLILFTFNPVYKYYVAGITPLLVLVSHRRRDLIAYEAFNAALVVIPRLLTSYLLLLLLGWLLGFQSSKILRPVSEKLSRMFGFFSRKNNCLSQESRRANDIP